MKRSVVLGCCFIFLFFASCSLYKIPASAIDGNRSSGRISGVYIVSDGQTPNQVAKILREQFDLQGFACEEFAEVYKDKIHTNKKDGSKCLWAKDKLPLGRLNQYLPAQGNYYFWGWKTRPSGQHCEGGC